MKNIRGLLCIGVILLVLVGCSRSNSGAASTSTAAATGSEDVSNYPERTIQFVIAANPGGGTDNACRVLMKYLPELLGGNTVITYIEGGGGTVGNRVVREAVPDGYTVSFFNQNIINNQLQGLSDFGMDIYDYVLVPMLLNTSGFVNNKFKTNDELVAFGRANPGKLRFGVEIGATNVAVATAWLTHNGIEGTIIDVGAVNGQVAAFAGDHVDVITPPLNTVTDYLANGFAHLIAIPSTIRSKSYPDTPTFIEMGINIATNQFYYIGLPKGVPLAIAQKFEAAMATLNTNPDYIADMEKLDVTPVYYSLEESATFVSETTERLKNNVKFIEEYEAKYGRFR